MECFICKSDMNNYFVKNDEYIGKDREFVRCSNCGLVIDKTIYQMTADELAKHIIKVHSEYQGTDEFEYDSRWLTRLNTQATVIAQMFKENVFGNDMRIADWGCGDGKLSEYFSRKWQEIKNAQKNSPQILKYDKYMRPEGDDTYLSDNEMIDGTFDAIITCSVFEHLIGKDDVDNILKLLNDTGVFCLHTLICEEVPHDPNWFYLAPDHVTIWTNNAMKYLFEEYGFVGCAYNAEAQMWFLFKSKAQFNMLREKKAKIRGTWAISDDFVDYWKVKPYRTEK